MSESLNNLSVKVFEQYTTAEVYDNANVLDNAVIESFETFYPGGLYGTSRIFVPADPKKPMMIANPKPYKFQIYNGTKVIYEGWKYGDVRIYGENEGYAFNLVGAFGKIGTRRDLRRLYVDDRITEDVWVYRTDASAAEKCTIDRQNRIRLTPKSTRDDSGNEIGWGNGEGVRVRYSAPTGETIKYVSFSYDLQEDTQAWVLAVYDDSNSSVWSVTSSGTGTDDYTFASGQDYIDILFYAGAAQTPASDGTMYGELSDIKVYAETNNTAGYAADLDDVIKDLVAEFSDAINSSTLYVGANTQALGAFITQGGGFETLAEIMTRVSGLGDSSDNPWAAGFLASTQAPSADGKPVIYYEQQPDVTGSTFDYQISVDGENISGGEIERNYDEVWNDIRVGYRDLEGAQKYRTSADNASLTDTGSIARWGTNQKTIDLGEGTATTADSYGQRFLRRRRYSEFLLPTPITVKGYILGSQGEKIPASEIRAGKLVRITDHVGDNLASTGANKIFLITHTSYDDRSEECTITTGRPEWFDVLTTRLRDLKV